MQYKINFWNLLNPGVVVREKIKNKKTKIDKYIEGVVQ